MISGTSVTLCLLLAAVCSGLVLERLPRHIPMHKSGFSQDSLEDDDLTPTFDNSVEKRKISQGPSNMAPLILKPTWKAIYPFNPEGHFFRSHNKRDAEQDIREVDNVTPEKERHELADILKDEDQDDNDTKEDDTKKSKDKKEKKANKHNKTKRQSNEEAEKLPEITALSESDETEQTEPAPNPDFQDWLRREYYRNMAKSFASMRRKRDGSTHEESEHSKSRSLSRRDKRSKKSVSFEEVTDNLRAIEDVLFLDALQTIKEAGDDYEEDAQKQRRITNDLSSAYDLETMRNALFRLKDTLGNMEQESLQDEEMYRPVKKRGDQCPPLELLTSDCSSIGDIVPDGPLKRLLLHACNWHEVCYTCGEVFGLSSENCDVGFVEQSQTICRGDVPCESTASLLLLPLRQRRVFYKRSNPSVCLVDTCVEDFLKQV